MVDLAPVKIFPDGIGFTMTKVRFFGDIGPQYDGFDGWRKEQRSRPEKVQNPGKQDLPAPEYRDKLDR